MTLDLQNAQLLAVTVIFALFAGAELLMVQFFPHAASAEDNRLDVAVGVMFPIISGAFFASSKWLMVLPSGNPFCSACTFTSSHFPSHCFAASRRFFQ